MARTVFNVGPHEDGWAVKVTGESEHREEFDRKEDAVRWAREKAKESKPSQLKVHGANGRIQTEYTYGGDPRGSKG